MDKKYLLRVEKVYASCDDIKINKLSLYISDETVTVVKSRYPFNLAGLINGDFLPTSGNIILAGINVGMKYKNERRVAVIPNSVKAAKTATILSQIAGSGINEPTYFELQRANKKAEIEELKNKLKKCTIDEKTELTEKLEKAKIDKTTLSLKIQRRKQELELNLKTANGLYSSLVHDKLTENAQEYAEKLAAKVFSAQYEWCTFTHKSMPQGAVSKRVKTVIENLELPAVFDNNDVNVSLACAYVMAPQLMLYIGNPTYEQMKIFSDFTAKTGVSIVVCADNDYETNNSEIVYVENDCFELE